MNAQTILIPSKNKNSSKVRFAVFTERRHGVSFLVRLYSELGYERAEAHAARINGTVVDLAEPRRP